MKKLFLLSLVFLWISLFPLSAEVRIGTYGINQFAIGDYAEYVLCTAGGGQLLEINSSEPLKKDIGLIFRLQWNELFTHVSAVSSYYNFVCLSGFWYNYPLSKTLSLQAELDYGIWVHAFEKDEGVDGKDGVFFDQVFQAQINLRWKFYHDLFTLSAGPVYSLLLERGILPQLFGFNIALLYSLDKDKPASQSSDISPGFSWFR